MSVNVMCYWYSQHRPSDCYWLCGLHLLLPHIIPIPSHHIKIIPFANNGLVHDVIHVKHKEIQSLEENVMKI